MILRSFRPLRPRLGCCALAALGLAATLVAASPAGAQTAPFPSRPIKIVVGFSPGGSNDIIARLLAPRLAEDFGQQVVVENRPGASGNIAIASVLASPPDGHTISMCTIGTFSIQPQLGLSMPFDSEKDIQPVTLIATTPYVLMVNASLPVKTVQEFVAYAKANPGKVNFASSGNGAAGHLAGEMFNALAGVQMVHVPYKGTGQALTDLVGGQVQAIFDQPVSSMSYVRSGQLRALAVGDLKRLSGFPDIPTAHESGVPNFDPVSWTAFCVGKDVPKAAVDRIQQAVKRALAVPEIAKRLQDDGVEPVGNTPDEFRAFLVADKAKWGRIIRDAKLN